MLRSLPDNAVVSGLTYGDWTVKWWQWAYSIAKSLNPLEDTDGSKSIQGQAGPVWFLGGTFGNESNDRFVRTSPAPAGKHILIASLEHYFHASSS